MQFKNPEVFYFLFLVLIPLMIHLFQFQKFVKIPFTNVAVLKQIQIDSRKSSQLKKYLILALRTLGLLAILFSFSQPYLSTNKTQKNVEQIIYFDNSLSISANGAAGNLFEISKQNLLNQISENTTYHFLTNDKFFENLSAETIKNILLNLTISTNNKRFEDILIEIQQKINNKTNTSYNIFLISDYQHINKSMFTNVNSDFSLIFNQFSSYSNLSVQSVSIENNSFDYDEIIVTVNNQGSEKKDVPIALYNQNKLISKQTFSINENATKQIAFTIQKNKSYNGEIKITFNDTFLFDNTFYFTLKNDKKINVLNIGASQNYISKIFTSDEFNLQETAIQNVNYNSISQQNLILLNELENIPSPLQKSLQAFLENDGSIVIVPNQKLNIDNYNTFLKTISDTNFSNMFSDSLRISKIEFQHPFFKDVFKNEVQNFQNPTVRKSFLLNGSNQSNIILYENNTAFFTKLNTKKGNVYCFTSALNSEQSNFQNSPVIVPVFYKMGKLSLQTSSIFERINQTKTLEIATKLAKDDIVTLANSTQKFIPLQQSYQHKVSINLENQILEAGFYNALIAKDTLATFAFNNPENESSTQFLNKNDVDFSQKNIQVFDSIDAAFEKFEAENKVNSLWKWFLSLAIVSLLLEMLILKFYKA